MSRFTPVRTRPRVIVAGGGVAGLEAALALRSLAGQTVDIDLVTPDDEFVYRPMTVAEPFGHGRALRIPLSRVERSHSVRHVRDSLARVDRYGHRVLLTSGDALGYDALIVATGGRPVPWLDGAVTFTGPAAVPAVEDLLSRLHAGDIGRLLFTAPTNGWTLPMYELALLTAAWCAERGVIAAELAIATPEDEPLAVFGPAAGRALRDLLSDRGVRLHTRVEIERFDGHRALLAGGGAVTADAVLALPRVVGVPIEGLPVDDQGFIPVGELGQVRGADGVFAVGDATTHPVKQGGLASQQADAAAAAVAQRLGGAVDPEPFRPVLRGLLLTGLAAAFLRADQGGSTAAFEALWSPPAKVAARYLGPYLEDLPTVGPAPQLADRASSSTRITSADDQEARRLALEFAEADAAWGDLHSALQWLRVIERREGVLPPELAARKRAWASSKGAASPR